MPFPFEALAGELRGFAESAVGANLGAPDLRRVLRFVGKVAQVAEGALQDVVGVLVEVKYLAPEDLGTSRLSEIRKAVDLLTMKSRFRDAEEICSRLHHLGETFREDIAPLVGASEGSQWSTMFRLIDEHEGALIAMVRSTVWELGNALSGIDAAGLPALNRSAGESLDAARKGLDRLRELSTAILGASGEVGLLELTETGSPASLIIHGDLNMSNDRYEIGQAGAVGPGAHAHDMTFTQVWNKAGGDIDVAKLAHELGELRTHLAREAKEAEHFVALGEVASAEQAAEKGDGPNALEHLKKAGAWAWDIAQKVGIGVATAAAKTALGV